MVPYTPDKDDANYPDWTPPLLSDFRNYLTEVAHRVTAKFFGLPIVNQILFVMDLLNSGVGSVSVINKTGSSIGAFKLVRISGYDATSGKLKIVLADKDTGVAQYITREAIANDAEGCVFKSATGTSLNTSSFSAAGDEAYLGDDGGFATSGAQSVGRVTVKDAATGQIRFYVSEKGIAAPSDAQYLTLATNSTLTDERVLVAGNGLAIADGGAGGNATLSVNVDGTGIEINADTLRLKDAGVVAAKIGANAVTAAKLNSDTAGAGLSLNGGTNALDVNVDNSSIEINSDTLRVKAAGVTNAMLAGSIDLTTKVTGLLPFANIANGSANSVLGRATNSSGVQASIAATTDGDILTPIAGTLGFNKIASISAATPVLSTGSVLGYQPSANGRFNLNQLAGVFNNGICEGRLTLTTATPVTTTDVTGASTLYFTPYLGNRVALYTSSVWTTYAFSELSLALSGLNPGGIYDVFLYDNSGTLTLETLQWTNTTATSITTDANTANDTVTSTSHGLTDDDRVWVYGLATDTVPNNKAWVVDVITANTFDLKGCKGLGGGGGTGGTWRKLNVSRATAIVLQDGVYCKTGALDRRYLGTFLATAATTTEDSAQRRYLWNMYNRAERHLSITDTTDTWNYTTSSYRPANGNGVNSVEYIDGFGTTHISAAAVVTASSSSGPVAGGPGIGLDSATINAAQIRGGVIQTVNQERNAFYRGIPGLGYHVLVWLEYGSTNVVFSGDAGTTYLQSGMQATIQN